MVTTNFHALLGTKPPDDNGRPATALIRPFSQVLALVLLFYGALLAGSMWLLKVPSALVGAHSDLVYEYSYIDCKAVSSNYGYDGVSFFRFALDPLTDQADEYGIKLKHPGYRQQRILLPSLAWVVGRGDSSLTFAGLLLVQFLSITGLTILGVCMATRYGYSAFAGALLAFIPGLAISVPRLLAEPLTLALMGAGVWLLVVRKFPLAAVCLAVAVLARETAVIVSLAWGVWWLRQMVTKGSMDAVGRYPFWLLGLVVFACMQAFIYFRWGALAGAATEKTFYWPFEGWVATVAQLVRSPSLMNLFFLGALVVISAWAVFLLLRIKKLNPVIAVSCCLYLVLFALMGPAYLNNSPASLRVTADIFLLGAIGLLAHQARQRIVTITLMAFFSLWLATAGAELWRFKLVQPTLGAGCAVEHSAGS